MSGAWRLAIRHALHARGQSVILVLCLAVAMTLPAMSAVVMARFRADLTTRADATPLVAGATGNRFDLVLSALYFRHSRTEPISQRDLEAIEDQHLGLVVPLHTGHTARGLALVGTTPEYFQQRGLVAARGQLPRVLGECVLGASAARAFGLGVGDALFSDQEELYDIARPPALKMHIVGVLERAGTPDDSAVFTSVPTCWLIDGLMHGHGDVSGVSDPSLLIGRTDEHVAVTLKMAQYNEVTPQNIASFHLHAEPEALPISSALVFPPDDKSATLIKAWVNARTAQRMLVPRVVIDDLLGFVVRIKSLVDAVAVVLGVSTALLTVLVVLLSLKTRAGELATLRKIGASRFAAAQLCGIELGLVLVASAAVAGVVVVVVMAALPSLDRVL